MTKEEIRAQLDALVSLNPKGHALEEGRPWRIYGKDDGGNYNGYVRMPEKFAQYFPKDDWGDCDNLPGIHGGCTYAEYTKDNTFTVGFDTLHSGDTSEYWTKERTIQTTEEWADEIADALYKILSDEEERREAEYMTVADMMERLMSYPPAQRIGFVVDNDEYKRLSDPTMGKNNVLYFFCECQTPE